MKVKEIPYSQPSLYILKYVHPSLEINLSQTEEEDREREKNWPWVKETDWVSVLFYQGDILTLDFTKIKKIFISDSVKSLDYMEFDRVAVQVNEKTYFSNKT